MRDIRKELPVFIISAHKPGSSDSVNRRQTQLLEFRLDRHWIPHKQVKSCYKGVEEDAFVVSCPRSRALELGLAFGQESVLFLDSLRKASLIYVGTNDEGADKTFPELEEHIGTFEVCGEEEARLEDAWAYDRTQDTHYRFVPQSSLKRALSVIH